MLVILVIAVIGGIGFLTDWFGLATPATPTAGTTDVPVETITTLASYKISVEDSSSTPTRYAGTGYCWNNGDNTKLLGGGSITLSATAATTVPSVNLGDSITCVAFDSSHLGIPLRKPITKEGAQDILESKNISTVPSDWTFLVFKSSNNVTEFDVAAGGSALISKVEATQSTDYVGYNFKKMCIVSNQSSSEINLITVDGMTVGDIPHQYRNTAQGCFDFATPLFIGDTIPRATDKQIVGNIQIDMTSSFSVDELINITFLGEHQFKSADGSVKDGIQDDARTPALLTTPLVKQVTFNKI